MRELSLFATIISMIIGIFLGKYHQTKIWEKEIKIEKLKTEIEIYQERLASWAKGDDPRAL